MTMDRVKGFQEVQTQEGEDIFNKVMQEFQEREQVRRNKERAKSATMYRDNQI